ncbi:ABC transporter ATP-binding protein [Tumebacillus sp. DT12]|uniref:ABC transporter ATP-binding protein n=1 Tax=Tumebacillus lacus TaxID=2995335 RepID=A0ABT3X0W2_9BACL|nr:ABC transporter ATP-binding protein [Tumebacillus lacus]MCX7569622.1 ABC transporter ATP-binding protein [Tumebacillus lacus]
MGEHVFTYSKSDTSLRKTTLWMLMILVPDLFIHYAVAQVDKPWAVFVTWAMVALEILFVFAITRVLRTSHRLTETGVKLDLGMWYRGEVPFASIREVTPYAGREPFLQLGVLAEQDENDPQHHTMFVVATANREKMVVLHLHEDRGLYWQKKKPLSTRVIVSVDEPERFLAAVKARIEDREANTNQATNTDRALNTDQASSSSLLVTTASLSQTTTYRKLRERTLGDGHAIEIRGLVKRYGDFQAVKRLDMTVRRGEIIGFLGSNGAGKTTTIKMMTGQLRPSEGEILIQGHSVLTARARALRGLGYVPDTPILYEGLTARQMLWFVGGLYGMSREACVEQADALLHRLGLGDARDRLVGAFSLGMKRKVAIAAGLMHRPDVLVLDEVTNGLDPKAAREVKDHIATEALNGTTVFLTTHILDVVEELADRVAIVERGELLALGTLEELRAQYGLPDANLETVFLKVAGGAR